MIKVIFILSIIVTGVAGFFAYNNGRAFANVRNQVAALNAEILREKAADDALIAEGNKLSNQVNTLKGEVEVEAERLKANKNKLTLAESDLKTVQADLEDKTKKKIDLETKLGGLPQGVKPETLAEDINRMKKELADFEAQATMKAEEVKKEDAKVAEENKRLADVNQKIADRQKLFERNSLTARVVAVNPDWGFVVINAGKNDGLNEATKLLVTRGKQTVGKVSVLSVQNGTAVAGIVNDAIVGGSQISPGDRVILENLSLGQ
ncbi:MAG: hypothetical protein IPK32_04590 [Verrucomicrobiaceae bacterium]|nr:hypothetical protein [Verrucomicrobiaceae bacterium]